MKALINKLRWSVHRALCYVGIHAPEKIFKFDEGSNDVRLDGWFCAVCTKMWEEKQC